MADADLIRPTTGPLRTFELIRDRTVEAVLGQSRVSHPGLAAEIRRQFGSTDVATGALVREPLIEGAAPFVTSGRTFADCAGDPLHSDVIRAIASDAAGDYRFPPDAQPYRHQLEAWRHLSTPERQSVLVSSGTGSGKTECFLMPLLSDLAAEAQTAGRLSGVRAIALYPLNALIASQQERLCAWTAPFEGRVRFGLYNGLTPERLPRTETAPVEQVMDRVTLRSDPPPILVTNVTMLEYMIVRQVDRPLVEASQGKLRWIILDEAHGYIGSAAAEIALLIRRVMLTFGVRAEDVRFVATSATIGDGRDVTDELRRFLRDLSGADERRVQVVLGERERVELPAPAASGPLHGEAVTSRDSVAAHPAVQAFIRAAEAGPVTLEQVESLLQPTGQPVERVIEAIAARDDNQRDPLLPLRIHGFMRAIPGLWSCIHPDCAKSPSDWPYGQVLPHQIDACPTCASPVFEIKTCRECGEPYLACEERDGHLRVIVTAATVDEFAATIDRETDSPTDDDEIAPPDHAYDPHKLAIAVRALTGNREAPVEPETGRRPDKPDVGTRPYPTRDHTSCGHCGAQDDAGAVLRPVRFGAPFLIGNAAPVLLEGVPPASRSSVQGSFAPPAEGRQLLSFTDSRQGTARFAANLQTNAERGYVRGHIYHAVQGSMAGGAGDAETVAKLRDEIAAMEAAAPEALADVIARRKGELAALSQPSTNGIAWPELRASLASSEPVKEWMRKVWETRDERYKDPLAFAEFLLLRELARRPRRANTVETMGLAWLRFAAIERSKAVPEPLLARGYGLADWHALLNSIVNMAVREKFAIVAAWSDMHWLHSRTPMRELLEPGREPQGKRELRWPKASKGTTSNLVRILEKQLGLDLDDAQDRARLNVVLEAAWVALHALFHDASRPGLALDFAKAHVAPVIDAWRCPVTGRVLPSTVLGLTPYGHREHLRTADLPPPPLSFPQLPVTFPRGKAVEQVRNWLDADEAVAALRLQGVWSSFHDRLALLSPYLRAAEHSAQQPPARLRRFENEFKRGEINILNCSTTMEMGVDIGSVSAVMMTNVPPALANYRQRVGRAGRRRQGFAASLTYTRDTALDREAFRNPVGYLGRQTRAPRVKLDSRRIVQRHVNALLLARWFASAGGEALKTEVGAFFGLPAALGTARIDDAPVALCVDWLAAPSTEEQLSGEVTALVAGTVLAGDRSLFGAARDAVMAARDAVLAEWTAIQQQADGLTKEAQASLGYQLKRLVNDNLLKELSYRGVLPAHGFPTDVVPFVNDDRPPKDEPIDDNSRRRRSFPTRTLDIAIRDYAPGAEVVVDGLVYRSAGVTLNWLRPADDAEAREVQSIRTFWSCGSCGAGDAVAVPPPSCPQCGTDIGIDRQRRFLAPAGFTADTMEQPHADTDEVTFVEPEPEQIIARGAGWLPMADPTSGRLRSSADGLVFYSSRGPSKLGYHLCLECGRAAAAGAKPGDHPLKDHGPLRFTKKAADGRCPGNDKPFKITPPIALGHEATTDVVELQPVGLPDAGAAWAAASALREALTRRLGVEASELGVAVRKVQTPLGQITHSLFLYDRASGGAGFAPQAVPLYDTLLQDALVRLDCPEHCARGCTACVLAHDLYREAEVIDRHAALDWAKLACAALQQVAEEDRAGPDAKLVRSVADGLADAAHVGARSVTIWAGAGSDVADMSAGRIALLARRLSDRGANVTVVVEAAWLDDLDPAQRLALRDAAITLGLDLKKGSAPAFANGASAIAAAAGRIWTSRDAEARDIGPNWGEGRDAPIVTIAATGSLPLSVAIDLASLLPTTGTRYIEIGSTLDGALNSFGERFAMMFAPAIRAAGGSGTLIGLTYSDRYLASPLTVRLLADALAGLRDALAPGATQLAVDVVTNPLRIEERHPFMPEHDWQSEQDRADVLHGVFAAAGFASQLKADGADHGRIIRLDFDAGSSVRIILDSGFGPWRAPRFAKWDHFGGSSDWQINKIRHFNAIVEARGPSYAVVTR